MKKYHLYSTFLVAILFLLTTTATSQIRLGLGAGVITDGSTALLQGRLEIGPRNFRVASAFNYFLDEGPDWAVDFDGHYNIADISDDIYLDLFPGINLLKVNDDTDIGINLGGAIRINTKTNTIFIEPKYTISTYDSFVITGGFIF